MCYIYGISGLSLLIESTDSMIILYTTKNIFQSDSFIIYSVSLHEGMDMCLGCAQLL